ncbi:PA4780 family RIO1-like protein kinase [Chromohalobacter canadensis]|uniref:non-specific serine/threonine protein kinase n=1 Tax=Chromohalobacter canadensis TaxID=141389 RepID=A0A285VAP9_9GAMM|nr:PA4780 family RIO1-like protein kinase [Chromohalobacter canadensis]MCK0769339.1 phosphotransferase [Chromohalobacter canadensis]WQH10606.1 PA4780 family RIO1-like protein kinase [Chromohalobacter canadensis]SOC51164.1 RIO kinase 1 [Chromohalobacter canadensis]
MKVPKRLQPLVDDGLIDEVVSQLMSGKEAQVYVVRCGAELRCAKVFKEASQRSFKQAVQYQEGRKGRNSRRARAMAKKTRYGQKEQETAWLTSEVDALYRLAAADVRAPRPHGFVDGVLLMDLISDGEDGVAPRLGEVTLSPQQARDYHDRVIADVVRMLCAGLVHGDLSEFNVLVDQDGPVIIDLPQAVDAAGNNSAPMLLVRDVDNMRAWFGRFEPALLNTDYGKEIWALYEAGELHPDSPLTGHFEPDTLDVDVMELMAVIDDAREEAEERRERARDDLEDDD